MLCEAEVAKDEQVAQATQAQGVAEEHTQEALTESQRVVAKHVNGMARCKAAEHST